MKNIFKTILTILLFISPLLVFAAELDSTNYKIVGATTKGGGTLESASTNYSALIEVGRISNNPRNYSTNYKMFTSPEQAFLPAVPKVSCFETITDGYSACTTGPSELAQGGMYALCGPEGCYDRARFEISDFPYKYATNDSRMVAYWPMDEVTNDTCIGGEDVCDVRGVNEGTAIGTTIVAGASGKARSFNGTSDYINAGRHSSLDLSSQGTISFWVKTDREYPSDDATTKYRAIISKTTSGGAGGQSYYIDWNGTNTTRTLRARISNGPSSQGISISDFDMSGGWKHFVFTFDGSYFRLYIDGELYGSPVTQSINAQYLDIDLNIGRAFQGSYYWDGLIDEVVIYNQGISASDVQNLYNSPPPLRNPSDTLYGVMISTDNFVSNIQYIDGSTFMPESMATHNINDLLTRTDWETEDFNIKGLQTGTTYYIRIFALKGDFTQTDPGPIASATTSQGSVFFDIDIADENGVSEETAPPHYINFTGAYELIGGGAAVTAQNRIWLDGSSNSQGGFAILARGINGGLKSPTTNQTIVSANANLNTALDGFGLQSEYIGQGSYPYLGTITATTNYSGSGNTVGIVGVIDSKIYDAEGPVFNGRMALKVIAKPGTDKTAATDYQETIYLLLIPRF